MKEEESPIKNGISDNYNLHKTFSVQAELTTKTRTQNDPVLIREIWST